MARVAYCNGRIAKSPLCIAKLLENFAYRSSSHIVALSPGMAQGIISTGYPQSRVTEIPNSADLDLFRPSKSRGAVFRATHGIDTDKILIVYAGTFGRINGVSYLVRLASLLRSDNRFFFLLVGDGHDFTEVHS